MDLKELYRDVILDHNRSPRNFGRLEPADATAHGHNPLCGDTLACDAAPGRRSLSDLRFEGQGCAISVASASLMSEAVKGRQPRRRSSSCTSEVHALLTGRVAAAARTIWASSRRSAACAEFPARVKCASLCWHTLHAALDARATRRSRRSKHDASLRKRTGHHSARRRGRHGARRAADHAQAGARRVTSRRRWAAASRSMSRATCIASPASRPTPSARKSCGRRELPPDATEEDVRELAWEQMRSCYRSGDPDQYRRSGPGL